MNSEKLPWNREAALLQECQSLASVLDLGIWRYDVKAEVLEWDTSVYRRYGVSREEFPSPGQFWTECLTKDSFALALREMQAVLSGEKSEYHAVYELRLPHGEHRHVLARASLIRDESGHLTHLFGINLDVTEQRSIELENRQLLARLREAQAIAQTGSWDFDLDKQELQCSSELYRIYEFTEPMPAHLLYAQMRSRIPSEELQKLDELVERTRHTGEGYTINHRLLFEGGREKHVQGIGHAVRDPSGRIARLHGTCRDQTKEFTLNRELEEERAKSNRNARLASLGELSAGVAHEINNPLAIIDGNARLLASCAKDPAVFTSGIQSILKACGRISRIVASLKKFGRASEPTPKGEHSIRGVIEDTLGLIEAKVRSSCAQLDLELNTEARILCDRNQLEQVLINLISNAADAIQGQPVKWIRVSAEESGNVAVIRVSNSGDRIPGAIQDKLFTPFFTTKGIGEGTGLGLSISKGIVEDHGGSITFVKESPQSCFEIRLPISMPER